MAPLHRSRVSSKDKSASHRLDKNIMIKREDTPVELFPSALNDDAWPAFDNVSPRNRHALPAFRQISQLTTSIRPSKPRGEKRKKRRNLYPMLKKRRRRKITKPSTTPNHIRKLLMNEKKSPLRVPRSFETWASEYLKLNARVEDKQSAYSMFMDFCCALYDKRKWGKIPVDLWFKIPKSIQWQWRQAAGVARLAVEDGLKGWKVNDRMLLDAYRDNFTEMRKYRSFRPCPAPKAASFEMPSTRDCVTRGENEMLE